MPRKMTVLVLILLLIEFMDEFIFGAREAAMPLIRADGYVASYKIESKSTHCHHPKRDSYFSNAHINFL